MRVFAMMALVCASLLAACQLFVDTSDLEGGPRTENDGGAMIPPDGTTFDGADAPDAAHAGLRFCLTRSNTFCADFDDGPPTQGWTGTDVTAGKLDLAPDGVSPPFALRVSLTPGRGARAARVLRDFAVVPGSVHVELDARLCSGSANVHEILKIEVLTTLETTSMPGYSFSGIEIQIPRSGAPGLVVQGVRTTGPNSRDTYPAADGIPAGVWTHLVLDAVLSTSASGSLKLAVDGKTALEKTGVRTISDQATGLRLVAGSFVDSLDAPCVDAFDNVVLDTKL